MLLNSFNFKEDLIPITNLLQKAYLKLNKQLPGA